MRKLSVLSTVLAAALACSSMAFAATPPQATGASTGAVGSQPRQHGMHRGRHMMGMLDQLDLSDTQRSKVHQLTRRSFEQAHSKMQALRQQRKAFENATPGSADYQAAATALAQAESNAARARVLREAGLRAKIYDVLTPAQRKRLADLRAQRETRMKQWRESHMQRRTMNAPASASTTQ